VSRMVEKGYTEKQVRLLCEWYLRVRKSSWSVMNQVAL
jgi:serine protein kinase